MGFLRAYLRVSTTEQDVLRAKAEIKAFANSHNQQISNYYLEQFTGTSLDFSLYCSLFRNFNY
jgi:DNA invertase Pin-like site-specific DNA recombinase